MSNGNMQPPPANIWGTPPAANQSSPPNIWGAPPPNPQVSPQAQPGIGHNNPPAWAQELTPDEKKIFDSFHCDGKKVFDAWRLADDSLAIAKLREMALRKVVFKVSFPKPIQGTNNLPLADGSILKAVVRYNYKLDTDNDKVEAALNLVERIGGPEGKLIAERLVNWNPSLSIREYDLLIEDAGKEKVKEQMLLAINQVITKTPATPSLEVKEPKDKGK